MATYATRLFDLQSIALKSQLEIIEYLQGKGLLSSRYTCPKCNVDMSLYARADVSEGYAWRCTKCGCRRSLRKGTWFESCHLPLMTVLSLTYMWVYRHTQQNALHELRIGSDKTTTDWYNFCREICTEVVLNQEKQVIGGPGVVVEIDESKFGKRKYNRGKHVDGKWVFGGVERGTNRCFLKIVENRTSEVLVSLIKEYIAPGTTIISDCWKSYDCLGANNYEHLTVNHSITFKDPETGAHTNTAEGMWSCVKRSFHHTNRTPGMFDSYLSEFMYRRLRKGAEDKFLQFLIDIVSVYPPSTFDMLPE